MQYEITTFNFIEGKAAYLAAHCILDDIPINKNCKGYVEYEGQIMTRKSVKAVLQKAVSVKLKAERTKHIF